MTMTIGIFEQEAKVLEAVRKLSEAGEGISGIRVAVKNREGAPLLTEDGNVPLEALDELRGARGNEAGGDDDAWIAASAPLWYPAGNTTTGAGPAGVVLAYGYDSEEGLDGEEAFNRIGVTGEAAKRCARATNSGHFVLLAETDREGSAASLLSQAGADVIE